MNTTRLAETHEIREWIKMLGWEEAHQTAVRWLEQQGLTAVPELLRALQCEKRRNIRRKLVAAPILGSLLFIGINVVPDRLDITLRAWILIVGGQSVYRLATYMSPRQKRIIEILWRLTDSTSIESVEVVGSLLETLSIASRQDWYVRKVVRAALTRLLPRLKASDTARLTGKHWDTLHRELQTEDAPLLLAILKALEQVADARSLPHVEKLVHRCEAMANVRNPLRLIQRLFPDKERMLPAEWRQVGEAAEVCREILQVRYEEREMEQSLLRPSEAFVAPSEELLRPAAEANSTPQEQLLRPK